MRILFLLEDYNLYYTRSIQSDIELAGKPYKDQLDALLSRKYYQSDSLANAFTKIGHQCKVIVPDCNPLQKKWAKENSLLLYLSWLIQTPWRSFRARVLKEYNTFDSVRADVLMAQVRQFKPEVVFFYSSIWVKEDTLLEMKKICQKIVLQWSCPIEGRWRSFPFKFFDLITTSSEGLKRRFSKMDMRVCFIQQAFDERVLQEISGRGQLHSKDVVFIGSFSPALHRTRIEYLNYLLDHIKIDIYCPALPADPEFKKIISYRKGSVSGMQLYQTYSDYKIALHIPGDEFLEDPGAKRLFEVTGTGTLLITMRQQTLSAYFKEGEEIVTFSDMEDCLEKIKYYLENDSERKKVAGSGQQRTLNSHSFVNRAEELINYLND